MANEPHAIRVADEVWREVRDRSYDMRRTLLEQFCAFRGALKLARTGGGNPLDLPLNDTGLCMRSVFHVRAQAGDQTAQRDFAIVYSPAGQCCYLVDPSEEGACQLIGHDESIDRLPEIVRKYFFADLVRLVEDVESAAEVTVSVAAAAAPKFSEVVRVDYHDLMDGPEFKGQRAENIRYLDEAAPEAAPAPRM